MTLEFTINIMSEVMSQAADIMNAVVAKKKIEFAIEDGEAFKAKVSEDEDFQRVILEEYMKELDVKRTEILEKNGIDKAVCFSR